MEENPEFEYMLPAPLQSEHDFWVEIDRLRANEAFEAIVALRKEHSHFMKKPVASVYVPRCENCYSIEQNYMEWETWRWPDITSDSWRDDLRDYGVTTEEIEHIESTWMTPHCHHCRDSIDYEQTSVYVTELPFEEYFERLVPENPEARFASKRMKRMVYEAYDRQCFGCRKKLQRSDRSIDHIQPFSKGGQTELMNLQLLCRTCDGQVKGNAEPEEEYITLHFPLVPPPSDGYSGFIW